MTRVTTLMRFAALALFCLLAVSCADSGAPNEIPATSDGDDSFADGDESSGPSATGEEELRGYFCENDADCPANERCQPFSDASAKICLPADFIRFLDAQTFIIDTSGLSVRVEQDAHGADVVRAKGFSNISQPGNPDLPSVVFNVLLPPDADPATLNIEIIDQERVTLHGTYDIAAAGPANFRPDLDTPTYEDFLAQRPYIVNGRNTEVYEANTFWPAATLEAQTASQMRKWQFVRVRFAPYAFNPASGELSRTSYIKAHVSVGVLKSAVGMAERRALLADRVADHAAANMFANYKAAAKKYAFTRAMKDDEPPKTDYCIMTTNAIRDKSDALERFIAHKRSIGYRVLLVTENEYGALDGQDSAERARNWLKREYARRGIQYLLILADPNPNETGPFMRVCWPRYNTENKKDNWEKTATDAYYADLTGDWDKDGDGIWCEYGANNGDTGSGGLDLTPELYVGRIPVYSNNTQRLDDILEASIAYELQQDIAWRRKVLLPNPISDFSREIDHDGEAVERGNTVDGATYAERMKRDFLNAANNVETVSLYDTRGPEPSRHTPDRDFNEANVCDEWSKGYGITSWWAHGNSASAAGKTWLNDSNENGIAEESEKNWEDFAHNGMSADCFVPAQPTHTCQVSCLNSRPDSSSNLGHYLLYKGGAITTLGATSVTLYTPAWTYPNSYRMDNVSFGYYYTEYLVKNFSAGHALAMVRSKPCSFSWQDGTLMNMLSFNVYGDPSLSVFSTYRPAEEENTPIFEDKGHAFDANARNEYNQHALEWVLFYTVKPGDQTGKVEAAIEILDADGQPLGETEPLRVVHTHALSDSVVQFDGDAPDRFTLDHTALSAFGSDETAFSYRLHIAFTPTDGEEIVFLTSEPVGFVIDLPQAPEGPETLAEGQSVSGELTGEAPEKQYTLTLDASATLTVELNGPAQNADFDLYLKQGEPPTTENYDARGYTASADERVSIADAAPGDWFVMVRRYSGEGAFEVSYSTAGEDAPVAAPLPLDELIGGELENGEEALYRFSTDAEGVFVLMLDSPPETAFHLFLAKDDAPTPTQYDAAATEPSANQTLQSDIEPGVYYLLVKAVEGSGDFEMLGWID